MKRYLLLAILVAGCSSIPDNSINPATKERLQASQKYVSSTGNIAFYVPTTISLKTAQSGDGFDWFYFTPVNNSIIALEGIFFMNESYAKNYDDNCRKPHEPYPCIANLTYTNFVNQKAALMLQKQTFNNGEEDLEYKTLDDIPYYIWNTKSIGEESNLRKYETFVGDTRIVISIKQNTNPDYDADAYFNDLGIVIRKN